MAARILDVAGLVTNRNTIPGDKSAFSATGVRIGTVWISQLGYGKAEIELLADAISTVLHGCKPFYYLSRTGRKLLRAKVESQALQKCREIVEHLTKEEVTSGERNTLLIRGERAEDFLDLAVASDVQALLDKQSQPTVVFGPESDFSAVLRRHNHQQFHLQFASPEFASRAALWFQDLSDGYVRFDGLLAKLPGPVVVETLAKAESITASESDIGAIEISKPYFIGIAQHSEKAAELPQFQWEEPDEVPLQRTTLHETHVKTGARMVPFAGWDMPVWYTSVSDEHAAVRNNAGLFDVSHMGVFEATGPHAANFLDIVTANDVKTLPVGRSHYTFFLLPNGEVVDDLLIYRRSHDKYLLVVNAANNDKDWSWLNAVNNGQVRINDARPWSKVLHPCQLRDLRDPQWSNECLVDTALQGPKSRDILLSICADKALAKQIETLPWAGLIEGNLVGFEVVISRTGYTGERIAFEIFVHPDQAPDFWNLLMEAGEPFGLKPCGLASRDSTRTEAGLPLYGHELAGPLNLNPADAGFGRYVKLWKPFFIGREPFIHHEKERNWGTVRFRMNEKAVRRPELGDPVLDRRGKIIGTVSSCAIDAQGYLTGLAYLPIAFSVPGTELAIYQTGGGQRNIRIPDGFDLGKRLPVPDRATVLTRFPKRK
jgi:glycine hydroxymethyltransferase